MATATLESPFKMKATSGGGDFELCPAGNHPAVCVGVIDLGTQEESYQGQTKEVRQVAIVWELPGENKSNGQPFVLAKQYTLSFGESANLRKMVQQWRGKTFNDGEEFDLESLAGKPCLLNVVHKAGKNSKVFHEVGGVTNVPKGMTVPTPEHDPIIYGISMGQAQAPAYDWLPYLYGVSIADTISMAVEFKKGGNGDQNGKEDIPF